MKLNFLPYLVDILGIDWVVKKLKYSFSIWLPLIVRADDFEARHHEHPFEPIAQFILYSSMFVKY